KHGISAGKRAESAIAEAIVAALEDTEGVARLRGLVLGNRGDEGQAALELHFGVRGRGLDGELLRDAVRTVAFSENGPLKREAAVVIERCAPEERAVGHQAG